MNIDNYKKIIKNNIITLIWLAVLATMALVWIVILWTDGENPEAILVGVMLMGIITIMYNVYKIVSHTMNIMEDDLIMNTIKILEDKNNNK